MGRGGSRSRTEAKSLWLLGWCPATVRRVGPTSRFALRHAPLAVACVLTIVLGLTAGQANAGTATRAGDWWQPGVDAGHTKFNPEPSDLTPFHVRHLQRGWSHHSPFFVPAAPAVVGNRLFIAGRNEDDSGAISELDASTGRLRWTRSQSCAAGPLSVVQDVLVVGDDCPTVAVGHSALSGARPYGGKLLWV